MNNAFPLLQLPSAFLTNTLRTMDALDLISFSFVSNRTKSLVVPLDLGLLCIYLNVSNSFYVRMEGDRLLCFNLCQENSNEHAPFIMDDTVEVEYQNRVYNWRKARYGVRDWIDHLMTVANQSEVAMIRFSRWGERFQMNSIKAALRGLYIKLLSFHGDFPLPYLLDVVTAFPLKQLQMFCVEEPSPVELHSVFAQNFDAYRVIGQPRLSVNELLIMNTKFLEIDLAEVEQLKMFNSFLKLWKTGCNRRLEYVFLDFPRRTIDETVDVILKGIKHEVIPRTTVRHFKRPVGVYVPEAMVEVVGGFDVQGINGRNVTIRVTNDFCQMFFSFE